VEPEQALQLHELRFFKKAGQTWRWSNGLCSPTASCLLIRDPAVEIHAVPDRSDEEIRMAGLDFRQNLTRNPA
jgi:hypothetical protein